MCFRFITQGGAADDLPWADILCPFGADHVKRRLLPGGDVTEVLSGAPKEQKSPAQALGATGLSVVAPKGHGNPAQGASPGYTINKILRSERAQLILATWASHSPKI